MTSESCGALNRLKSIFYDAESVSKIISNSADIKIIANLRAGKWYCSDPSVKTCYFKSTDGHNGQWDFNTRRLNIPLLETLLSGNPVMIVDATANRRKVYPDALSKTVPIWIYVMNHLIASMRLNHHQPQLSAVQLPRFLNETEKHNLLAFLSLKTPEWLLNLKATLDESTKTRIQQLLKTNGVMQLVPMFVSYMDPFNEVQFNAIIRQNNIPVVCFSVGTHDPICIENQFDRSFTKYILGAGDDEEMWSMGLSPEMFWKDPSIYLASLNDAELEKNIKRTGFTHYSGSKLRRLDFMNQMVSIQHRHDDADQVVSIRITTVQASFYRNIGSYDLKSKYGIEPLFPKLNRMIHQITQRHKIQKIELICNDFKVAIALLVCALVRFMNELLPTNDLVLPPCISKEYIRKIISYVHNFSDEYQMPRSFCQQLNRFYIGF